MGNIAQKKFFHFCFQFFIFLTILFHSYLFTEINVAFDRILLEQGYPDITVNSIIQDPKGFIWFGTPNGLYRYDGYFCIVYKHDPMNIKSISNSEVSSFCLDRNGILWIGTENGLNRFNWKTETFSRYLYDKNILENLGNNEIEALYEDRSGFLWIGTYSDGLIRFNRKSGKFRHFKYNEKNSKSLSNNRVTSIIEDSNDILWIGTVNGLNRYNRKKETFRHYKYKKGIKGTLNHNFIWTIYEDRKGILWIGTWGGGLNKYIRNRDSFSHYLIDPIKPQSISNRITSILEDRYGTLWVGTRGGGLTRFLRDKETFVGYVNDTNDPRSLSKNMVTTIYEDKAGVLWIGTAGGAINRYNRRKQKFFYHDHNPNKLKSLSHSMVFSIYEDHDRGGEILWIGTYSGLNRFDRRKNRFTCFKHDPENFNSISNSVIRYIYEDKNKMLWVGTDGGLNRFDRETGKFESFQHEPGNPKSISYNLVGTIYEDRKGRLWIGTDYGLNLFNRRSKSFRRFTHDPENRKSMSSNNILCIHEQLIENNSFFWIGTYNGGLNKFKEEKNEFLHYKSEPDNPNTLSNNNIRVIHEDKNGILWLGTDGGLNRFEPKTGKFSVYSEKDGLPNNKVFGILEDEFGHIWLSTKNGLSRFNVESRIFKNFDISHGLQVRNFNQSAFYKSQSGEMFFGSINGFISFFPGDIKDNPHKPDIVITDFRIFNKSVKSDINEKLKKSIIETDEIILSYKDNFFSFEFAALEYTWPEKNEYAYKMEGFDKNWIETDAQTRLASYTNLSPGKYTFRVKGSNNDGIWNEEGVSIRIIITPPFWQTWWFQTLAVLFLLFSIFAGYKWRTKLLRNKLEEQERVQKILKQSRDEMEKSRNLAEFRNAENEKLIAAIPSLFVTVEANGKVSQWNHSWEKFIGIPGDDIKEQLLVDLLKDHVSEKKMDEIIRMGLHSDRFSNNIEIPVHFKKDNDLKLLLANISPIIDKKGKKFGFLLLAEDITHRKKEQMQRFLSQKLEALGQMAAGVAHEIRSPLQYIGDNGRFLMEAFNSLIELSHEIKDKIKKAAESGAQGEVEELSQLLNKSDFDFFIKEIPAATEQIVDGVARVSNIVKSMYAFSHTGNGVEEKADLNKLLKSTLVVAQNRIKKVADLETNYAPDLPHIPCSMGELNQVFLNLLVNAVDAIAEAGKRGVIKVSTKRNDDELIVEISDNGIGIPDEIQEKIFTPFFTTKDVGKGTGQGLHFSYRIVVERHKGKLYFKSKAGEGSTFYVHLPF